jgi:ribose-phosphate pyrophosphokinase
MSMAGKTGRAAEVRDFGCDEHIDGSLRLFGGTGNRPLAEKIAAALGIPLGGARVDRFPDGETIVKLEDDVRGRDCFVIQSTCPPVNETLMELLIFIDCLRRASARRITAVMPYFGYARQDRKAEGRTPITAKLVANLITEAGADRILAMDLHAEQLQGFFDIPLDHLTALPVLCAYIESLHLQNSVLVSPDVGNVKTTNAYAARLGADMAVIDKRRMTGSKTKARRLIGEVKGRTVLMFDDMITTAGTVLEAVRLLREHGAHRFCVSATHAVFAPPAVDRLEEVKADQIVVTDTIPLREETLRRLPNIKVLSVAELMAQAILRIHKNQSVSALFDKNSSSAASPTAGVAVQE